MSRPDAGEVFLPRDEKSGAEGARRPSGAEEGEGCMSRPDAGEVFLPRQKDSIQGLVRSQSNRSESCA
jgi:hypothetical protein